MFYSGGRKNELDNYMGGFMSIKADGSTRFWVGNSKDLLHTLEEDGMRRVLQGLRDNPLGDPKAGDKFTIDYTDIYKAMFTVEFVGNESTKVKFVGITRMKK